MFPNLKEKVPLCMECILLNVANFSESWRHSFFFVSCHELTCLRHDVRQRTGRYGGSGKVSFSRETLNLQGFFLLLLCLQIVIAVRVRFFDSSRNFLATATHFVCLFVCFYCRRVARWAIVPVHHYIPKGHFWVLSTIKSVNKNQFINLFP